MKIDHTLLISFTLLIFCLVTAIRSIELYGSTQELQDKLRLAQKEVEELTKQANVPKKSCGYLQLEVVAQKRLNKMIQEHIVHLEKLEFIYEEEDLDFQSLVFRVQELEEDCRCK